MSAPKFAETGVSVSMPQGLASVTTTPIEQQPQPTSNVQQPIYHYEPACLGAANQQQHSAEQQQASETNPSTLLQPTHSLANIKEKTPMCLINDLARYNRIKLQYQLTGKKGPAHKHLFAVTLKLGTEEYKAKGASIKKAQHSAAAIALQQTKFKHPPPKAKRNRFDVRKRSEMVTPTVELNVLTMKHGVKPVYVLENEAPASLLQDYISQSRHNLYGLGQPRYNYDPRRHNNSARRYNAHYENRYHGQYRYQYSRGEIFSIRLHVGEHEYRGLGYTVQAARHDAASKAIEDIKQKEMYGNQQCPVVNENELPQADICHELNTELESPISLVHTIAWKRNLNVTFEVLDEKGPSHKKMFLMQCRVGDLMTEGEGNSKKISKKRAAEEMLEELSKAEPLPNTTNLMTMKRQRVVTTKRRRNLIKANTEEVNPISHLINIQQANKEKGPVFNVIEERGEPRSLEFVIEASVNGHTSTGVGPNKKIAKRNAAEALLALVACTNSLDPQSTLKLDIKTKCKLESSEMLNSGCDSAPTEVTKTGQVQAPEKSPQIYRGEEPTTETLHKKTAIEALHLLSELGLDDVTANTNSNTQSVHDGSTAKSQMVPKAEPNQNEFKK